MPNEGGMGLGNNISCTSSQSRYEMVDVAIKIVRHIGIVCKYQGNFIHLDVYPSKPQDLYGLVKG
jgi:hypothetical protein